MTGALYNDNAMKFIWRHKDTMIQLIEAKTKWSSFADSIFKFIPLTEKRMLIQILVQLFFVIPLTWSQHVSNNGLLPNKWQAIIWTNDD